MYHLLLMLTHFEFWHPVYSCISYFARTKQRIFPYMHYPACLCNVHGLCSLPRRNWRFLYNLGIYQDPNLNIFRNSTSHVTTRNVRRLESTIMGWSSSKNVYWQNRRENISGETRWKKKSRKTKINMARLYLERCEIDTYVLSTFNHFNVSSLP
jgi:hypothetical protein